MIDIVKVAVVNLDCGNQTKTVGINSCRLLIFDFNQSTSATFIMKFT